MLVSASLTGSAKKIYDLLDAEHPRHIDDIVETSGLNSSEVLATLFELEMKSVVRQLLGNNLLGYCSDSSRAIIAAFFLYQCIREALCRICLL